MPILQRIRAALDPRVTLEDLQGPGAFTPVKDLGEQLGRAYGIETPRARRQREELAAQHDLELGLINGRIGQELETLVGMDPESADHRAIVSELTDRAMIVGQMLESPFAEMQGAGMEELSTLMADIHQAGLDVEQRRIRDAELEAAGLKEEIGLYQNFYDDLYRESADFLTVQSSFGALRASYAKGIENAGNANDIAAINSLQRMIDPGVSVREGDVSLMANLAGVPDMLVTVANRVVNEGARFTPEQRLELLALGNDLMKDRNALQSQRNGRFQGIARETGMDDRFVSRLSLPIQDTGELPSLRESEKPADVPPISEAQQAGRVIGERGMEISQSFRERVAGTAESLFNVDIIDGVVYRKGSIAAERARLDLELERTTDPERKREIEQELRVLDAAEGRPAPLRGPRRGTIERPTN